MPSLSLSGRSPTPLVVRRSASSAPRPRSPPKASLRRLRSAWARPRGVWPALSEASPRGQPASAVHEQRGYNSSLNHPPTVNVLGRRRARWAPARCSPRAAGLRPQVCAPRLSRWPRYCVGRLFALHPLPPPLVPIRPASVLVPAVQPERCAAHRCVSARLARRRGGRLVEPRFCRGSSSTPAQICAVVEAVGARRRRRRVPLPQLAARRAAAPGQLALPPATQLTAGQKASLSNRFEDTTPAPWQLALRFLDG